MERQSFIGTYQVVAGVPRFVVNDFVCMYVFTYIGLGRISQMVFEYTSEYVFKIFLIYFLNVCNGIVTRMGL